MGNSTIPTSLVGGEYLRFEKGIASFNLGSFWKRVAKIEYSAHLAKFTAQIKRLKLLTKDNFKFRTSKPFRNTAMGTIAKTQVPIQPLAFDAC